MEKQTPLISVVTPSYNQGKYINKAIESVHSQGNLGFEHIIVDNCSNDKTLKILKNHSHLKWISEPDKGQSDALNKGFKMASGDIIGWLNADDFYLPDTFNKIVKAFEDNPEADIIYGNWFFVDQDGKVIKHFQSVPHNHRAIVYYGPYIGSTALFFKRSIIEENILLDINFRYTMDWEWYARLGNLKKNFAYINDNLAGFRVHGENVSLRFRQMSDMEKIYNRAKQLAEGQAIKRFYGARITRGENGSILEDITLRTLWWVYRIRILLQKLYFLSKGRPKEIGKYVKNRKAEVSV